MDGEKLIQKAMDYVADLFRGDAGGHDAQHTMRVFRNATAIAEQEECDRTVVALSALLHDADDHKLFSTENNANARKFLGENGVSPQRTEEICRTVNMVSFSRNRGKRPETAEGRIVQDADRLDAIGAVGIARTFAFGGAHGRDLDDSIQHFYDKLLLLKDEMNTEAGKREAERRHRFLEMFLEEYREETKEKSGA